MTKGTDIRELALGVLLEVSAGQEYSHIALRNVLDKYQYLEKQERAFLTRLVEGTLERRIELDYIIDQFSLDWVMLMISINLHSPLLWADSCQFSSPLT